MKRIPLLPALTVSLALLACNLFSPGSPSSPNGGEGVESAILLTATALAQETSTPAISVPSADTSPVPTSEASATEPPRPDRPEEAILILEPGPGSRVVSPVRIAGLADPTLEQHLFVQILADDGTIIAEAPTTIQADQGSRGPFDVEIAFSVSDEQNAFIQVSTSSPRDGGLTHLSSVGVTLAASGPADIRLPDRNPVERIQLFVPPVGGIVRGGVAHVVGFGFASFEATLLIQVQDASGAVVGEEPVAVAAPDLGQPGPFSAEVPYRVMREQPGRIVVLDPSASGAGYVHVSSVEVTLRP